MQFVPKDPIHPGEILKEDFLAEYGLSADRAAIDLGVNGSVIDGLVAGTTDVTAELALRLSRYFETSPEFWLNLQRSYDLSIAMKVANGLDKIQPVRAA